MRWAAFHRARRFGEQTVRGQAAIAVAAGLSAIMLALLVLVGGALTDLLSTRGDLEVSPDARAVAEELAGKPDPSPYRRGLRYYRRGLLPLVWRLQETPLAEPASWLYRHSALLADSGSALGLLVALCVLIALGTAASMFVLERAIQRRSLAAAERLRSEIHRQAVRLGAGDMLEAKDAAPGRLFEESVEQFRQALVAWRRVWPQATALLVLLTLVALVVQLWLAVTAIVYSLLVWLVGSRRYARERHHGVLLADRSRQQAALMAEDIRQARFLANFFSVDRVSGETFEQRLRRYHSTLYEQHTSMAATGPILFGLILTGAAIIVTLGGVNILHDPPRGSLAGTLMLGAALLVALYPLRRMERLMAALPKGNDAAAEVFAYLDRQPSFGQLADAIPLPRLARAIAFQQVSLTDGQGRRLLHDVSFSLPTGSRTMVVSSARETPEVLGGLLSRFYNPTSGAILFDGQDIRRGTLASVRDQIAWIVADSLLVTGTVAENINCGDCRLAGIADVIEAAKVVHAYDFIQRLPQGFDTIVGEHGATLSASETMRVGLARAVLRRPTVILIDEPPVLPDVAETELLADSVRRAAAGRWLVVLARRLATLRAAERILLFHDGQLVGDGTHAELFAASEIYRHLNYVRFNEFAEAVR